MEHQLSVFLIRKDRDFEITPRMHAKLTVKHKHTDSQSQDSAWKCREAAVGKFPERDTRAGGPGADKYFRIVSALSRWSGRVR